MRLPWEQIAMEVIEVSAPELAAKLDISEAEAGWGIILAIKWALARCPDHQPPSANAVVKGSSAARQIARAAGYRGDPEAYVQAATTLAFPTLEMVPEGIRFRGLDRYDSAWSDRNREAWKAWKAAHPDRYPTPPAPAMSPPEPRRNSGGDPPGSRRSDPDPDPDADPSSPPPPREPPKLVVVGKKAKKLTVDDLTPAQREKWERIQVGRRHKHLLRETDPPAAFPDWCAEVDARCVDGERQWVHALTLYLRDEHFADRKWPTAVFITSGVWLQRLPQPPEEVML